MPSFSQCAVTTAPNSAGNFLLLRAIVQRMFGVFKQSTTCSSTFKDHSRDNMCVMWTILPAFRFVYRFVICFDLFIRTRIQPVQFGFSVLRVRSSLVLVRIDKITGRPANRLGTVNVIQIYINGKKKKSPRTFLHTLFEEKDGYLFITINEIRLAYQLRDFREK